MNTACEQIDLHHNSAPHLIVFRTCTQEGYVAVGEIVEILFYKCVKLVGGKDIYIEREREREREGYRVPCGSSSITSSTCNHWIGNK